jgi:hypothetical protein
MKLRKIIGIILLAVFLIPTYVLAQDVMEMKGTVVSMEGDMLKVKTRDAEETLKVSDRTKGKENATAGTKVTIKYAEKDGEKRVREIAPR